ncbi:MAG: hypothetical protein HC847_29000 [Hydrococcus sp. RU_2_2]|nr:hypothetical protein [Hydrococcus sp. RU_2_2]NJP20539.1 hypothetical protein [Hydrococcus sp. CRU_1_1]
MWNENQARPLSLEVVMSGKSSIARMLLSQECCLYWILLVLSILSVLSSTARLLSDSYNDVSDSYDVLRSIAIAFISYFQCINCPLGAEVCLTNYF